MITDRQKEVLQFIIKFKQTNGFSPTINEIMQGVNTHSRQFVMNTLDVLQSKGYIDKRPNVARSIIVKKFW